MKKLFLTFLLLGALIPGQALANSFSGQATVIDGTVAGFGKITLVDTGPLPSTGGSLESSLLDANIPGLLSANVLHATTIGMGDQSRAEASVAKLNLTVAGNTIGANLLMSRARASCGPNGPSASGTSDIVDLMINGQTITVTGEPNQTINLPPPIGGYVRLNEQDQPNSGDITVSALHVFVPGIADLFVSRAHADITCTGGQACPADKDFVTGGGRVPTPNGEGSFGVAGGMKDGGYWGHLTFIDHGSGMKVKGTGVTRYIVTGPTTRHIEGTCETTPQGDTTYLIDVDDQGEPGNNDKLILTLMPSGYKAGVKLDAGNIQLHICK